jgi:methyl-accepting chemotaxis protein
MRIGRRIALGYGVIIAITLVIGLLSFIGMRGARAGMEELDTAHLPAMQTGNTVERSAWALFFHMRGYDSSYDTAELAAAREQFREVASSLERGAVLAEANGMEEFARLDKATADVLARYGVLMDDTEEAITAMLAQRQPLASAQQTFGERCDEFLKSQTTDLETVINRSQRAIVLAQGIVEDGGQARVLNYQAQSTNDHSLFEQAKTVLSGVFEKLSALEEVVNSAEERNSIAGILEAARNFEAGIDAYYAEIADEEDIDVMAMMRSRQAMEESAAAFSVATQDFLGRQNETLNVVVGQRLAMVNEASTVLAEGNHIIAQALQARAERRAELMREALAGFKTVYAGLASMRAGFSDEHEIAALGQIEESARSYETAVSSYLKAWDALLRSETERGEGYRAVLENAQKMAALGMRDAVASSADNAAGLARASTLSLILMLVGVAVALVLAILSTRKITGALRGLVGQLNTSSGSVSTASGQVSQASRELAEGSSQQAASVEETSSSLEELASMTRQNAEHAATANKTVESTSTVVSEASEAMTKLTASMEEIASGSKETQKIIKTIDEIAFQTNLLALNAAVEAARAGEAGAGFAVVADEVRNLAIRAAEAARNTAGLIEGSVKKIDVGANLVAQTNDAFGRVARQTNEVRSLIANIATASGEQSNGIEQINKAVSEMDRVVQRNASGAEETAAAAGELSSQAVVLDRVVAELNALLDGAGGSAQGTPQGREHYGDVPVDEDEFSFEAPSKSGFGKAGKSTGAAPKKVASNSSGAAQASTSGVIRDSEMSHDDFEFDETDFNFEDDSFDPPKR